MSEPITEPITEPDADERNMPIFARCHDLLRWLVPCVQDFPRAQRHLLAQRVLDTAFDVLLETLRTQWRLAHELRYISPGQYEHGARLMAEIGRMLGGWRRAAN